MRESLFARKSIDTMIDQTESREFKLKKVLGAMDLTLLGIGCVIGTGIFVLTGVAAAKYAGPAIVLSFVISGLACAFAALCYAEFAAMIPVAGSAYTYAYATLGELLAWIIGWDLILEYAVGSIAVSIGWSGYLVNLLAGLGIHIPAWASSPPLNIPAALIVALITVLLVVGIKETSRFNSIIVAVKLAVILFFIGFGIFFVKPANWTPFLPFGLTGVMTGAAIVFFAYIGFDAVSTTAEETRNPTRDLPIGIIASLLICTLLYIAVSAVLTGIVPLGAFSKDQHFLTAPIAFALSMINQNWASGLISLGAITGITSVLLVLLMGQPRIFFAMSRDGLLPAFFSKVHPDFQTPYVVTIVTGVIVGLIAMLVPIGTAAELTNIGTLFAFVIVCAGVMVLRKVHPDRHRSFKTPLVYLVAPLGIVFSGYLMYSLPVLTWLRFLVWLNIGLFIYYFYGRIHSKLTTGKAAARFSKSNFTKFLGVLTFLNGFLFGVLSVLALLGATARSSWAEVNLQPQHSLGVCLAAITVGVVLWGAGHTSRHIRDRRVRSSAEPR
jgi:APA family basic amino acid/polyamine antiporter